MEFRHTLWYKGKEYRVSIDWDSFKAVSGNLVYEIKGAVRDPTKPGEPEEVTLTVETRAADRLIVISHDGQQIAQIPLDLEFSGEALDGSDLDPEEEEAAIWGQAALDESAPDVYAEEVDRFREAVAHVVDPGDLEDVTAELIIQSIPTDPFLGCLLKSAASTLIGQLSRCWQAREGDVEGAMLPLPERVSRIGACIREHAVAMGWRFMWRAGKCFILGGLG